MRGSPLVPTSTCRAPQDAISGVYFHPAVGLPQNVFPRCGHVHLSGHGCPRGGQVGSPQFSAVGMTMIVKADGSASQDLHDATDIFGAVDSGIIS